MAGAQALAQTICDRLEDFRFTQDNRRFRIGASIGLVPIDQHWPDIAAVMQAADRCCQAAKEAGRNRVHSWVEDDVAVSARHDETQWAARLEQALDDDSFVLYAQRLKKLVIPRRSSGNGGRIHAEILLRLKEPDGTITLPGAFLPAAERFHIASRIDRWVLSKVIEWMQAVENLNSIELLCVNLSGQSVETRRFAIGRSPCSRRPVPVYASVCAWRLPRLRR
jgi:predicted signal transduction protein with EAL and GGDEF domain